MPCQHQDWSHQASRLQLLQLWRACCTKCHFSDALSKLFIPASLTNLSKSSTCWVWWLLNPSLKLGFRKLLLGLALCWSQCFYLGCSSTEGRVVDLIKRRRLFLGSLVEKLCWVVRSLLASTGYANKHLCWKRSGNGGSHSWELFRFWWLLSAITAHQAVTYKLVIVHNS